MLELLCVAHAVNEVGSQRKVSRHLRGCWDVWTVQVQVVAVGDQGLVSPASEAKQIVVP